MKCDRDMQLLRRLRARCMFHPRMLLVVMHVDWSLINKIERIKPADRTKARSTRVLDHLIGELASGQGNERLPPDDGQERPTEKHPVLLPLPTYQGVINQSGTGRATDFKFTVLTSLSVSKESSGLKLYHRDVKSYGHIARLTPAWRVESFNFTADC